MTAFRWVCPAFFGIPLPTVDEIAALDLARHPACTGAAPWIHRIALTVGFLVVLPRVLLAGWAWLTQQRLRRKFPIDLREAYYQRLLRRFRGTEARVVAVSYTHLTPPARDFVLISVGAVSLKTKKNVDRSYIGKIY